MSDKLDSDWRAKRWFVDQKVWGTTPAMMLSRIRFDRSDRSGPFAGRMERKVQVGFELLPR
jgi:hypothetical protein